MNPFTYTVQPGDYRGLNYIAQQHGFSNYGEAGITSVPSGNFNLIRPGDVITFGQQPRVGQSNPGIVSTQGYRDQLNLTQNNLNEFANDPYMQMFTRLREQNKQAEETARLNAEAQANREKVQEEQRFRAQQAGTGSANIAGGLSRYAPELATSQMNQVRQINLSKVEAIQNEEDLAIARAKDARAANDLDVMQEELAYVQELRKEKARAIEEANRLAFDREKFEEDKRQFGITEARLNVGGEDGETIDPIDAAIDASIAGKIVDKTTPTKGLLFRLAKKLGITRTMNFKRSDDIKRLTEKYPSIIDDIRALLKQGKTPSQIIEDYSPTQ